MCDDTKNILNAILNDGGITSKTFKLLKIESEKPDRNLKEQELIHFGIGSKILLDNEVNIYQIMNQCPNVTVLKDIDTNISRIVCNTKVAIHIE